MNIVLIESIRLERSVLEYSDHFYEVIHLPQDVVVVGDIRFPADFKYPAPYHQYSEAHTLVLY